MKTTTKPAVNACDHSSKPVKRYARTPDNILVALGCEPTRLMRSKLKLWMSWPDFPKAGKNGRDIEALKQWVDDNQDVFLADGKRAKLLQEGDKFSGGDLKLMRSASAASGGSFDGGQSGAEPEVMGYAGIAEVLARHFQIPVSKMDISDWCHGKRLDHGVPNFPPPKASGRFNKLEAVNWFKQYKFHDPRDSSTPDLFKKLETQRATGELERLEHEQFMRGVERSQYIGKSEHNRTLAALGGLARNTLWELFDRAAYDQMAARLTAASIPEEFSQFMMGELRRLNPELLHKFAATLNAEIQALEQETEKPNPNPKP